MAMNNEGSIMAVIVNWIELVAVSGWAGQRGAQLPRVVLPARQPPNAER